MDVIRRFSPGLPPVPRPNYTIATHYHKDHVGEVHGNGIDLGDEFKLVGLTHLMHMLSITRLYDHGTDKPGKLGTGEAKDMESYFRYRRSEHVRAEKLEACRSDQLLRDSARVTTLKSGLDVCMNGVSERMQWTETNENELSLALFSSTVSVRICTRPITRAVLCAL